MSSSPTNAASADAGPTHTNLGGLFSAIGVQDDDPGAWDRDASRHSTDQPSVTRGGNESLEVQVSLSSMQHIGPGYPHLMPAGNAPAPLPPPPPQPQPPPAVYPQMPGATTFQIVPRLVGVGEETFARQPVSSSLAAVAPISAPAHYVGVSATSYMYPALHPSSGHASPLAAGPTPGPSMRISVAPTPLNSSQNPPQSSGCFTPSGQTATVRGVVSQAVYTQRRAPPTGKSLFIKDLHVDTEFTELESIFGEYGELVSCRVLRDAKTGTSRRIGYINFAEAQAAGRALNSLNGRPGPHGAPFRLQFADDDPSFTPEATTKLFVRYIPLDCTEAAVRDVFSQFGEITDLEMAVDQCRAARKEAITWNMAYITYARSEDATAAIAKTDRHFLLTTTHHLVVKAAENPDVKKKRQAWRAQAQAHVPPTVPPGGSSSPNASAAPVGTSAGSSSSSPPHGGFSVQLDAARAVTQQQVPASLQPGMFYSPPLGAVGGMAAYPAQFPVGQHASFPTHAHYYSAPPAQQPQQQRHEQPAGMPHQQQHHQQGPPPPFTAQPFAWPAAPFQPGYTAQRQQQQQPQLQPQPQRTQTYNASVPAPFNLTQVHGARPPHLYQHQPWLAAPFHSNEVSPTHSVGPPLPGPPQPMFQGFGGPGMYHNRPAAERGAESTGSAQFTPGLSENYPPQQQPLPSYQYPTPTPSQPRLTQSQGHSGEALFASGSSASRGVPTAAAHAAPMENTPLYFRTQDGQFVPLHSFAQLPQ
jgi:hypothetical protein